jgi:hypothetical protein
VKLFNNCNGLGWSYKVNWCIGEAVATWHRVEVDEDAHVVKLQSGNNNLKGKACAFYSCTLYLPANSVGVIPACLANFTNTAEEGIALVSSHVLSGKHEFLVNELNFTDVVRRIVEELKVDETVHPSAIFGLFETVLHA